MNRICILTSVVLMALLAEASWYWPFGSSDEDTRADNDPPRLSELMEPATTHIENAFDFAADGKTKEAIEEYRKALAELDKIEASEPERSQTPEFASLRTKRAYVTQAIESLLLAEVQENAKAVAVTDTTELEKKLRDEMEAKRKEKEGVKEDAAEVGEKEEEVQESQAVEEETKPKAKVKKKTKDSSGAARDIATKDKAKPKAKPAAKAKGKKPAKAEKPKAKKTAKAKPEPKTPAEKVMVLIQSRRFEDADKEIEKMLSVKPHNEVALNLRAKNEIERGDLKAAEKALDQAIQSNPQSYYAYYNMVQLVLKQNPENKTRARRYYETGRAIGGPKDENLEKLFK